MYADSGGIYGLWQRSFTSLKKERGIRPLTVKLGIAFHSDMSSKETSLVCKINIFYITKNHTKNHRGQVNRPERVNQGTCPCDPWPINYRTEQKYFLNFFCRFGEYSYLCVVLSVSHVRLTKRRYETFDCSIPRRTATPKRKDEQTLPHWSGRFMRKLQHMW